MALQSLVLPILSVFRSAGLQQASGVLNRLTGNFDNLAGKIGLAAGSFSAFSALTSARQFAIDSVNTTARFERNILGLNQVFESVTPQIRTFTKEVENYGLSQAQAAQASVFLGSVLKQYGFTTQQSADQTERLVTLAQDLATTYGYDVQEALLAITALFRGEYDPIEKFGVAMKQSEVNARLAAEGLNNLEGEQLANAQATARLTMLFERADDAVGAFGRASDTLYASQQRLNAVIGNLQIAFGAPLQEPLSQVNQAFADLAQEFGPEVVDIATSLGSSISSIVPILKTFGETFFLVLAPLQQVVDVLNIFLNLVSGIAVPIAKAANDIIELFVQAIDASTSSITSAIIQLQKFIGLQDQIDWNNLIPVELMRAFDWKQTGLDQIEDYLTKLEENNRRRAGTFDAEARQEEVMANRVLASGAAFQAAQKAIDDARQSLTYYQLELEKVGSYSKDAEGNLIGLAALFRDIDTEARKSQASIELERIGFNAAQIEYFLTRPDWQAIFGEISRLARIAALDVSMITSADAAERLGFGLIEDARKAMDRLRSQAFSPRGGSTRKAAKDTVSEFFGNISEEIKKQAAREKLKTAKASEGLIDAILGSDAWEKLVARIDKGTLSLEKLQKQFNKTTAGVKELDDERQKSIDKQLRYDAEVKRITDALNEQLKQIEEQAKAVKLAFSDLLEGFRILPTIEREVGRFEAQVTQMLASVEQSLRDAFRNKDILEAGYNELRKYAQLELEELRKIGQQRDELAKRYDLAKGLIDNYKRAFTAATNLTQLFSALKDETEKRTVTVVTSGVVRLGTALREFGVTITKSYEEPIAKMQNKTKGLVDEFRNMAEKARAFAANLRRLQEMGLNGELFNQLVEAGVVAGGETAQALVDGGKETVDEINDLFKEINTLGADLGEEVASTMYSTGINMVDGLLEGIRSKQMELENQARTMAEAFNKAFQGKLDIAVDVAAKAASDVARAAAQTEIDALGTRPVVPTVPNPALEQLDAMIANANKFINATKNATNAMGAISKREIFEDVRKAIAEGAAIDVSAIRSGMSSAELVKAIGAQGTTGGNIVNNAFYIQPGNRAHQNATVESLKAFINQNGNLVGYGIQ